MGGPSPSESSRSRKKNCRCSKVRCTPLYIVSNNKAGSKRNGGPAKPDAKQNSIHSRAPDESIWRNRKQTGTVCPGPSISSFVPPEIQLQAFCEDGRPCPAGSGVNPCGKF